MKLEVVVEVSVQMILMRQLFFLILVVGGVIGAGIIFCIFTISTNHGNTTQAIRRATILQHKCLIAALNLHATTHFHCFDILQLKKIIFLRILAIFKMKNIF